MRVSFFVAGLPQTKGSTRAFVRGKRAIVTNDNEKAKPWQHAIRWEAEGAIRGLGIVERPEGVSLTVVFQIPRPAGHYRKSGLLRPGAPSDHTTKNDLDKMLRVVLDALTGVAYEDDSQVWEVHARKVYAARGDAPGVLITVEG